MSGVCVFVYLFFPLSDFSFCCVLISLFAVLSFLSVAFLLQDEIMVSSVCVCVGGGVCVLEVWLCEILCMSGSELSCVCACDCTLCIRQDTRINISLNMYVLCVCWIVVERFPSVCECIRVWNELPADWTVNGQVAVVGNAWLLPFTRSFLSCILPAGTHTHTRTHTDAHTHTHTLTVKEG